MLSSVQGLVTPRSGTAAIRAPSTSLSASKQERLDALRSERLRIMQAQASLMARPRSVARSSAGTPAAAGASEIVDFDKLKDELRQARINEDLLKEKHAQQLAKEKDRVFLLASEKQKLEEELKELKFEKFRSEQLSSEVEALKHQLKESHNWKSDKDRLVKELEIFKKENDVLRNQLKSEKSQRLVLSASFEEVQKQLQDVQCRERTSVLAKPCTERQLDSETIPVFSTSNTTSSSSSSSTSQHQPLATVAQEETLSFIDVEGERSRSESKKNSDVGALFGEASAGAEAWTSQPDDPFENWPSSQAQYSPNMHYQQQPLPNAQHAEPTQQQNSHKTQPPQPLQYSQHPQPAHQPLSLQYSQHPQPSPQPTHQPQSLQYPLHPQPPQQPTHQPQSLQYPQHPQPAQPPQQPTHQPQSLQYPQHPQPPQQPTHQPQSQQYSQHQQPQPAHQQPPGPKVAAPLHHDNGWNQPTPAANQWAGGPSQQVNQPPAHHISPAHSILKGNPGRSTPTPSLGPPSTQPVHPAFSARSTPFQQPAPMSQQPSYSLPQYGQQQPHYHQMQQSSQFPPQKHMQHQPQQPPPNFQNQGRPAPAPPNSGIYPSGPFRY